MGVENFLVYAPDCVTLGLGLMERKDDPDVRKTCYLLFASLASVMKGDMAAHLPKIMERMMMSLRSTDGVVVSTGGPVEQKSIERIPAITNDNF